MPEKFYTPRQVFLNRILPLGQKTIYKLVRQGKIKAIRIGGGPKQARFKISEVEIKRILNQKTYARK